MSRTEVAVPLAFVGLGVTIVTALVFLVTPMIGKGLPSLDVRLPEIGREAPAQRIEPGPPAQFDPAGSGDPACPVVEGRPGALADDSLALDLPPGWLESSVGHAWLECGQSVESSSGDAVIAMGLPFLRDAPLPDLALAVLTEELEGEANAEDLWESSIDGLEAATVTGHGYWGPEVWRVTVVVVETPDGGLRAVMGRWVADEPVAEAAVRNAVESLSRA